MEKPANKISVSELYKLCGNGGNERGTVLLSEFMELKFLLTQAVTIITDPREWSRNEIEAFIAKAVAAIKTPADITPPHIN